MHIVDRDTIKCDIHRIDMNLQNELYGLYVYIHIEKEYVEQWHVTLEG